MSQERRLALGTALFLASVGIVYWAWSGEYGGTVLLIFGGFAYALMFAYVLSQAMRRHNLPRPEDRSDAKPEDGVGDVHFFPANSIWPAALGLGAVLAVVGLAFGKWFWVIGGAVLLGAIIGYTVEAESR
ncbi:MAG: cytochrome c oxidase subunit 4 [Acidimicrobiales bacterium]